MLGCFLSITFEKPRGCIEGSSISELIAERERYWIQKFLKAGVPLTNIQLTPNQSLTIPRIGWVSIREAARQLGDRSDKIAKLANRGRTRAREDPLDERVRLVDINELRALLASRPRR